MDGKLCTDDGREVKRSEIAIPDLCLSCRRNDGCEVSCDLTRMDQMEDVRGGGTFCCFGYEPREPAVDRDAIIAEMERYLAGKG